MDNIKYWWQYQLIEKCFVEYSTDLKYDETDMSSVQKSRIYHPHNDLLYILNKRKEMLLTENFSTNNQTDLKQGNHHQQIVSEVLRWHMFML